jgi:hypothetical protein
MDVADKTFKVERTCAYPRACLHQFHTHTHTHTHKHTHTHTHTRLHVNSLIPKVQSVHTSQEGERTIGDSDVSPNFLAAFLAADAGGDESAAVVAGFFCPLEPWVLLALALSIAARRSSSIPSGLGEKGLFAARPPACSTARTCEIESVNTKESSKRCTHSLTPRTLCQLCIMSLSVAHTPHTHTRARAHTHTHKRPPKGLLFCHTHTHTSGWRSAHDTMHGLS